jgi:hypothetical protein
MLFNIDTQVEMEWWSIRIGGGERVREMLRGGREKRKMKFKTLLINQKLRKTKRILQDARARREKLQSIKSKVVCTSFQQQQINAEWKERKKNLFHISASKKIMT